MAESCTLTLLVMQPTQYYLSFLMIIYGFPFEKMAVSGRMTSQPLILGLQGSNFKRNQVNFLLVPS